MGLHFLVKLLTYFEHESIFDMFLLDSFCRTLRVLESIPPYFTKVEMKKTIKMCKIIVGYFNSLLIQKRIILDDKSRDRKVPVELEVAISHNFCNWLLTNVLHDHVMLSKFSLKILSLNFMTELSNYILYDLKMSLIKSACQTCFHSLLNLMIFMVNNDLNLSFIVDIDCSSEFQEAWNQPFLHREQIEALISLSSSCTTKECLKASSLLSISVFKKISSLALSQFISPKILKNDFSALISFHRMKCEFVDCLDGKYSDDVVANVLSFTFEHLNAQKLTLFYEPRFLEIKESPISNLQLFKIMFLMKSDYFTDCIFNSQEYYKSVKLIVFECLSSNFNVIFTALPENPMKQEILIDFLEWNGDAKLLSLVCYLILFLRFPLISIAKS